MMLEWRRLLTVGRASRWRCLADKAAELGHLGGRCSAQGRGWGWVERRGMIWVWVELIYLKLLFSFFYIKKFTTLIERRIFFVN